MIGPPSTHTSHAPGHVPGHWVIPADCQPSGDSTLRSGSVLSFVAFKSRFELIPELTEHYQKTKTLRADDIRYIESCIGESLNDIADSGYFNQVHRELYLVYLYSKQYPISENAIEQLRDLIIDENLFHSKLHYPASSIGDYFKHYQLDSPPTFPERPYIVDCDCSYQDQQSCAPVSSGFVPSTKELPIKNLSFCMYSEHKHEYNCFENGRSFHHRTGTYFKLFNKPCQRCEYSRHTQIICNILLVLLILRNVSYSTNSRMVKTCIPFIRHLQSSTNSSTLRYVGDEILRIHGEQPYSGGSSCYPTPIPAPAPGPGPSYHHSAPAPGPSHHHSAPAPGPSYHHSAPAPGPSHHHHSAPAPGPGHSHHTSYDVHVDATDMFSAMNNMLAGTMHATANAAHAAHNASYTVTTSGPDHHHHHHHHSAPAPGPGHHYSAPAPGPGHHHSAPAPGPGYHHSAPAPGPGHHHSAPAPGPGHAEFNTDFGASSGPGGFSASFRF